MTQITRLVLIGGVLCAVASPASAQQDPQWARDLEAQVQAGAEAIVQTVAAQFGQDERDRARAERDRARAARDRARAAGRGAEYTEPFTQTVKLGQKGTVDLIAIAGDVTVTAGGGDDVTIDAVKRVRGGNSNDARARLQDVGIQVDQRPGLLEIRTGLPGRNASATVDFKLTVPSGTSLTLKTVSGNVTITNVKGDISANTVSGDVTLRGTRARNVDLQTVSGDMHVDAPETDRVRLQSVSGDIAYAGKLSRNGRYDIQTHSGDIQLHAPDTAGFDLEASTFSGDISSEYPVTLRGARGDGGGAVSFEGGRILVNAGPGRSIRGSFGDASAVLTLRTFSGDIAIVKK
jgi:hypothetical protein